MVTMNYTIDLDCDENKFLEILRDYENLINYLPRQLQKIKVIETQEDYVIIEVTIFLRSIIKKEFIHKLKIETKSQNVLIIEVLDGMAKGTKTTISVLRQKEKSVCEVNTNAKLSLKSIILMPIMKKEYSGILDKLFKNVFLKIK